MQVRDRMVRGLALHLDRLDSANQELFGFPLDGERVRELIGHALDGARRHDASVRVHGFMPPGSTAPVPMVTVRGPAPVDRTPRSLMSVPFARAVPHIKRPGEFAQTYYGQQARRAGFDDALLTSPGGMVTEGRSPTSASGTAPRSSGRTLRRWRASPWRCWTAVWPGRAGPRCGAE